MDPFTGMCRYFVVSLFAISVSAELQPIGALDLFEFCQ